MQFKINKRLNQLLYLMIGIELVAAVLLFVNRRLFSNHLFLIFAIIFIYNIVCFFIFKTLEKNWDKRIIQKMVLNNQVVIANIKSGKIAFPYRDSSYKKYNMWEITVDYIDHDMSTHEFVFYEKLNPTVEHLPKGTVFLTNDNNKPGKKFIVPNVLISHSESLMPIVQNYEKQKKAYIKYLNVYYDNGLVIETYQQSMKKQNQRQKELEQE